MGHNDIQKILSDTFSKSDKNDWKKVATAELNGKDPFEELCWRDADGIEYPPYDDYSVEETIQSGNFQRFPRNKNFYGSRSWLNVPHVHVVDDLKANHKALAHLRNGADGIWFNVHSGKINIAELLNGIEWPYCSIFFSGHIDEEFLSAIFDFIKIRNYDFDALGGNLFPDEVSRIAEMNLSVPGNYNCLGCYINSSTPVNEICEALITGAELLEKGSREKISSRLKNISFSLPVHNNFLIETSKLRALRMLWFQVAHAFDVRHYELSDLHIHARMEKWSHPDFAPHENMLRGTTGAMASIIGGCDSITVFPGEEDNELSERMARNISNILREESHFDKVEDQLAGSYTIETMTHLIAQRAWSLFQTKVKAAHA